MCVIEARTYIYPNGTRSTGEVFRPCSRSSGKRPCGAARRENVERRIREATPSTSQSSSPFQGGSSPSSSPHSPSSTGANVELRQPKSSHKHTSSWSKGKDKASHKPGRLSTSSIDDYRDEPRPASSAFAHPISPASPAQRANTATYSYPPPPPAPSSRRPSVSGTPGFSPEPLSSRRNQPQQTIVVDERRPSTSQARSEAVPKRASYTTATPSIIPGSDGPSPPNDTDDQEQSAPRDRRRRERTSSHRQRDDRKRQEEVDRALAEQLSRDEAESESARLARLERERYEGREAIRSANAAAAREEDEARRERERFQARESQRAANQAAARQRDDEQARADALDQAERERRHRRSKQQKEQKEQKELRKQQKELRRERDETEAQMAHERAVAAEREAQEQTWIQPAMPHRTRRDTLMEYYPEPLPPVLPPPPPPQRRVTDTSMRRLPVDVYQPTPPPGALPPSPMVPMSPRGETLRDRGHRVIDEQARARAMAAGRPWDSNVPDDEWIESEDEYGWGEAVPRRTRDRYFGDRKF